MPINDQKISIDQLRKVIARREKKGTLPNRHSPDKPQTPEGYPDNFAEAINYRKPCAVALQEPDTGKWVWYAFADGMPLLKNKKFGPESQHATFEDALEFARAWLEWKANKH